MNALARHLADTGQTQTEFAQKVASTQPTISRVCAGQPPTAALARRIVAATKGAVSYDDLYGRGMVLEPGE